jgi:Flp pilus assembly CpaF family ATPase
MDRLVLDEKLESLARCVRRVEQKRPPTLAALLADPDAQDILVLNLSRAVQILVSTLVAGMARSHGRMSRAWPAPT